MPRYSPPQNLVYSFGPGAVTPVVKTLIWVNVGAFLVSWAVPQLVPALGLNPRDVLVGLQAWQLVTYMFLHHGIGHILFNMLALWMFGVELERMWGRSFFLRYYFIAGIGAGVTTLLLALAPGLIGQSIAQSVTVGASGAIYGLLLAYGLYFPDRPIYVWMLFPVPAKYFVMIMGAIAFLSSVGGSQGGVAASAHLGGLVTGYLYLRVWRKGPLTELRYRYVKWRMNRLRKKFNVYDGRRHDWDRRVH